MNRIGTENQGVLWCWYGRFIKHFYGKSQNGGRFSGEDDNKCKKKCTFAAHPYFDVQNTDERHSFVKHFYFGFLLFSLNNFNFLHQDFMFQLNDEEYENLRCKNSTSSWSGRRYNPYAFIVSLQKNTMKLKSSAVIWQGVKRKKQRVVISWQGVKTKKQGV